MTLNLNDKIIINFDKILEETKSVIQEVQKEHLDFDISLCDKETIKDLEAAFNIEEINYIEKNKGESIKNLHKLSFFVYAFIYDKNRHGGYPIKISDKNGSELKKNKTINVQVIEDGNYTEKSVSIIGLFTAYIALKASFNMLDIPLTTEVDEIAHNFILAYSQNKLRLRDIINTFRLYLPNA